jgi:hypothetical protein
MLSSVIAIDSNKGESDSRQLQIINFENQIRSVTGTRWNSTSDEGRIPQANDVSHGLMRRQSVENSAVSAIRSAGSGFAEMKKK